MNFWSFFAPVFNRREASTAVSGGALVAASHDPDPATLWGSPLQGLTPAVAASILAGGMRGEWTRAQWLMYYAEQLEATLYTLAEKRLGAISQVGYKIRLDEETIDRSPAYAALAEEQADALRLRYSQLDNLREALTFLAAAKFRGYSHLAIGTRTLEPIDQWWWLRDGMYGPWVYNPSGRIASARARRTDLGDTIDPAEWIIRTEARPLIWLAITTFLRGNQSQKWWDKYCEICSRNGTVIIAPQTVQDAHRATFLAEAQAIAAGGSGVLDNGASVASTTSRIAGQAPYRSHLEWLREQLVLAGTGGLLATLAQSQGIGNSTSSAHADAFAALLRADCKMIAETMQAQLDRPTLTAAGLTYSHQTGRPLPLLAYFELDVQENPTPKAYLEDAALARTAGFTMSAAELSEKTGYSLTVAAGPAPILSNRIQATAQTASAPAPAATSGEEIAAALADQLGVSRTWIAPLEQFLEDLLQQMDGEAAATPEAVADLLETAAVRVPEVFGSMDIEALTTSLEAALGEAAVRGAQLAAAPAAGKASHGRK